MELVFKNVEGSWFYESGKYISYNSNGVKTGVIMEQYIPDPVKLWQSRCESAEINLSSMDANKYTANVVTQKLWEHKNAKSND